MKMSLELLRIILCEVPLFLGGFIYYSQLAALNDADPWMVATGAVHVDAIRLH